MKPYWTIGSIPELQPYERKEQRRLWRIGATAAFGEWKVLAGFVVCGIFSAVGSVAGHLITGSIWGSSIGAAITGGSCALFVSQYATVYARRYIAEHLARAEQIG